MSGNSPFQNEFIRMAVNGLFVVILAFGLGASAGIFVPLEKLQHIHSWYSIIVLSFPFTVIVTSWMGFMSSIVETPYKVGKWGNSRFITDLLILFSYYILFNLVKNENVADSISDDGQIFFMMPIIFFLYLLWDGFKFQEYKNDPDKQINIRRRSAITATFLILFLILSLSYNFSIIYVTTLEWESIKFWIDLTNWQVEGWTPAMSINLFFVGISYVLIFRYRNSKAKKRRYSSRGS